MKFDITRSVPTVNDCMTAWYRIVAETINEDGNVRPSRKIWEYAAIFHAIRERVYTKGRPSRGIGFGVGREPLPALFALCGVHTLATDQVITAPNARAHWGDTGQLSQCREDLRHKHVCTDWAFDDSVTFANVNMKDIPHGYDGQFDFTWSAGSLEHLGDMAAGEAFIRRSVECLRPGGYAVHTTELNLELNGNVCESGDTCFYRRADLEAIAERLRADGHTVEPFDFRRGTEPFDTYIEYEPYNHPVDAFALEACGVITTSVIIIIQRNHEA